MKLISGSGVESVERMERNGVLKLARSHPPLGSEWLPPDGKEFPFTLHIEMENVFDVVYWRVLTVEILLGRPLEAVFCG